MFIFSARANPKTYLKIFFSAAFVFTLTFATEGFFWLELGLSSALPDLGTRAAVASKDGGTEPIVMVAFGDMMLDRYVWILMQKNGLDYPFEYFPALLESMLTTPEGERLPDSDFTFANLEGPISDSPYVNPGTAMIFNFKPEVVPTLQKYGFNLFSLANNHAYDMGAEGAQQTRDYLAQGGINYFGDARAIGENTAWITTVKGTTLTFIGFNDTVQDHLDYEAANELIRSHEATSDFTIVSIHWGIEYRLTPSSEQVEHAHGFVEAGADVILGQHPHVIQYVEGEPVEWVEGPDGTRPVYYSMGNFIFDQYFQKEVQEGLGVTLVLKKAATPDEKDTIEVQETVFDILESQPQTRASPLQKE